MKNEEVRMKKKRVCRRQKGRGKARPRGEASGMSEAISYEARIAPACVMAISAL
jgi:hypothetical protein